jgi:hypothetical protein
VEQDIGYQLQPRDKDLRDALWDMQLLSRITINITTWSTLCRRRGFVSALIDTLIGDSRTAQAQPLGSRVPEVDRLAVRMVTDNEVIQFVPSEKREGLTIERRTSGNQTRDAPPRTTLTGEWGLSMHAESQ